MTRVEYVACDSPRVTRDETRNSDCRRLVNGLNALAGHCDRCDNRIRTCKPRAYRVRDDNGHIITSDWVMAE